MSEWKASCLKAGDRVACNFARFGGREWRVGTVKRVTQTQLTVGFVDRAAYRFSRRNGREVSGSGIERKYLYEATPERMVEEQEFIERGAALLTIRAARWDEIGSDKLKRIAEILKEHGL